MTEKRFKSTLICPYGSYMNETANPISKTHYNDLIGGWYAFCRKYLPKSHRNFDCRLYWKNRFRTYKRLLVMWND